MIFRPRSIYFRHLASHLFVIIFLVIAMLGLLIYMSYTGNGPPALMKKTSEIAEILASAPPETAIPDSYTWNSLNKALNATLWLADPNGNVIAGTPPDNWNELSSNGDNPPQAVLLSMPTYIAGQPAILYAHQDSRNLFWALSSGRSIFVYPFLLSILAAILIGLLLSRNLTNSIADIASTAARFAAGDHSSRTKTTGNDELGDLGKNFNTMADAIMHTEQTRRDFYANISHELKTPLTCIQATTEALLDGIAKTPEQHAHYLQKINAETVRMSKMVRELLDMEQLEAGKLQVRREQADLHHLLSQQADKLQHLLLHKSLSLILRLETEKRFIWGDPDRLTQIFDNLLSNAIRHSPSGSQIQIILSAANNCLKIVVTDQGEGISEEELPLIWDRFYRTDKSRGRNSGGSGLGLPIARSLTEAMGGSIRVHSVKNQGTTFTLEFPVANQ